MTRYDPFAYGEVRLDPNRQNGGTPPDADDLLFDPGEATKQAPPADASWSLPSEQGDAAPPMAHDPSDAAAFGNDILGESVDADPLYGELSSSYAAAEELGAPPEGMPALSELMGGNVASESEAFAMPADEFVGPELIDCGVPQDGQPQEAEVALEQPAATAPSGQSREVRRRNLPVPATKPIDVARLRKRPAPRRRSRPAIAAVLPLVICAVGGTGASWFWVMQANPVMAGILVAGTLVSALFSWLLLRG